ncbi:hypothetical protein ACFO3I_07160 [Rheinheimera marina]|uniref:Uncharacterized protein n=2 Tax=Rheinheimera marina TaxID=1774958 RepID=A0ABV9JKK5_9GAMM
MLTRLAQSNKLSKYKLVIDIIHDEDTELFHRTFTQAAYDFYMGNVKDKYKEKSTENDSLNVFYRYISGDLKRIIGKGNYDRIYHKVNLATAEIFTEIKMLIQQKYDFKNYGASQSYIQHNTKSFAYASILTSPIVTILEVLNSKKSDFVRNVSINGGGLIGGKLIENFTKEGNVNALRSLGINFNIYVIDAETCRTFLEKLNSDVKKREESTLFFTDF